MTPSSFRLPDVRAAVRVTILFRPPVSGNSIERFRPMKVRARDFWSSSISKKEV
jgi:hypothetical protein